MTEHEKMNSNKGKCKQSTETPSKKQKNNSKESISLPKIRKKFAVVSFSDSTVFVVPTIWLSEQVNNSYICFWPPKNKLSKIKKAAINEVTPNNQLWTSFPVTIINQAQTYVKAAQKLLEYQQLENVDLLSPVEREAGLDQSSEIANNSTNKTGNDIVSIPHGTQDETSSIKTVPTCSNCSIIEEQITSIKAILLSMDSKLATVTEALIEMKMHIKRLKKRKKDYKYPKISDFPNVTTVKELNSFNKSLNHKEKFAQMVCLFGNVGGKNSREATRKVLCKLINNDLAKKLIWKGGSKRSIQEFKNIVPFVTAAVQQNENCAQTTLTEVGKWLAHWLRNSACRGPDYKKQRNLKRKKMKENPS